MRAALSRLDVESASVLDAEARTRHIYMHTVQGSSWKQEADDKTFQDKAHRREYALHGGGRHSLDWTDVTAMQATNKTLYTLYLRDVWKCYLAFPENARREVVSHTFFLGLISYFIIYLLYIKDSL